MSEYDLMKLFSQFEGEVGACDFTPEELMELLAQNNGKPMTMAEWKRAYFEKYDDVKDKSLKKQDW